MNTPAPAQAEAEVIYRGAHNGPSGAEAVWLENPDAPGQPTGILTPRTAAQHSHSPTGFSWGYAGSGPAELARAILVHALGDEGLCPTCQGALLIAVDYAAATDKLIETPWRGDPAAAPDNVIRCVECDGTGPRVQPSLYQPFKFEVVALWPQDGPFTISRAEVLAWYRRHQETTGQVGA